MPRCGTLGDLFPTARKDAPTKGSYQLSLNKWGTRASRRFAYRGARHRPKLPVQRRHTDVCTPPAGCGKQSRDLIRLRTVFRPLSGQRRPARATKVRAAGAVHSPNSAAKFNIPVMKRSTGRIQNQSASAYFVPVKQKNERGDLFLSRAWYGGRIPGKTGYMGALACAGSTPAAPSFVRARSCPKSFSPHTRG